MKENKKRISFESDNLAVPEIHTGSVNEEELTESEETIVYDTVAIPEIKFHNKKKN